MYQEKVRKATNWHIVSFIAIGVAPWGIYFFLPAVRGPQAADLVVVVIIVGLMILLYLHRLHRRRIAQLCSLVCPKCNGILDNSIWILGYTNECPRCGARMFAEESTNSLETDAAEPRRSS